MTTKPVSENLKESDRIYLKELLIYNIERGKIVQPVENCEYDIQQITDSVYEAIDVIPDSTVMYFGDASSISSELARVLVKAVKKYSLSDSVGGSSYIADAIPEDFLQQMRFNYPEFFDRAD